MAGVVLGSSICSLSLRLKVGTTIMFQVLVKKRYAMKIQAQVDPEDGSTDQMAAASRTRHGVN